MRWAVVWVEGGQVVAEEAAAAGHGSNNQAEMLAVIHALEAWAGDLTVVSDSAVVVHCATGSWRRRANLDLWRRFDRAMANRKGCRTCFRLVKGHHGDPHNERADRLAAGQGDLEERHRIGDRCGALREPPPPTRPVR